MKKETKASLVIEGKSFNLCFTKKGFSFEVEFYKFIKNNFSTTIETLFPRIDNILDLQNIPIFESIFFSFNSTNNVALDLINKIKDAQTIKNKKGFLYLVTDGTYTKIGGTSYRPEKRLLELQTGNAKRLAIMGAYTTEYLHITEKIIHNQYKDKQVLNEWFLLDPKDIDSILSNKYSFTETTEVKELSHLSIISIMQLQKEMLYDKMMDKYKLLKRCNLLIEHPFSFLSSTKSQHFSEDIREKLIAKRIGKDFNRAIEEAGKSTKLIKEIDNLLVWYKKLQSDIMEYIELHNIEYDDEKEQWVYSDIDSTPLSFNDCSKELI